VEALAEDFMQTGSSALASVGATKELEDVRDNYEGYKTELIKDAMKSSSNKKV
jgi:hypothetical protein